MGNKGLGSRLIIIFSIILIFFLICVFRLANLQLVNGNTYKEMSDNRMIRSYPIKAPRGEIFDMYGRPLVSNSMAYTIQIQSMDKENNKLNDTLISLLKITNENNITYINDFPIKGLGYTISFSEEKSIEENNEAFKKWKKEKKIDAEFSAEDVVNYYAEKYDVSSKYTKQEILDLVSLRYTMSLRGFNITNPFVFAKDIDMVTVQKIKEHSFELPGVSIEIEPIREYVNGNMAAHILGRTGIIYEEEYNELKELGYGMNDIIGKEGLEKVLEKYLKGTDGYKKVEQTKNGNVAQILSVQETKTPNYAVLTLDSKLQAVTESALKKEISETSMNKGTDCRSGAAVAVDISTGGVLAMASYPDYNPQDYTKNYTQLLNDSTKPLFNRALNGGYTPGSTFKPLTSIAGLEEGIITPNTVIEDKGVYKFYAPSYQPTCLIWRNTGTTHGKINVSQAIGVSCNYFFYEIGRLVGIDKISEYARKFGLGEETGIELAESTGIVAGPEYREKLNMEWYPGDTLQAAIGQSDNMYTPAQLASYVATILNKGKRYKLHLISEVKSYETGECVYKSQPEVVSDNPISDATYNAVKDGMRRVTDDGTASAVFADFPIAVAGKTGTAEVTGGSDTVLFVGFAPYDNPQIAVAVVLEHGATSSYAAKVARSMFECYLGITEVPDATVSYNSLLLD